MLDAAQSSRLHHTLAVRKLAEGIFAPKSSTFHGFRDFKGHSWAFQVRMAFNHIPLKHSKFMGFHGLSPYAV